MNNESNNLKEENTEKEIKGIKKFVRFTTIVYVLSIIFSILGIVSCVTKGSVKVWQHVILWLTLIITDSTILVFVRSIKNAAVTVEEKENDLVEEGK